MPGAREALGSVLNAGEKVCGIEGRMDIATWKSTALPLAKKGLIFLILGAQDTQNVMLHLSLPPARPCPVSTLSDHHDDILYW